MESNIHSSFIPQDTVGPSAPRPRGGSAFDFLTLIAVVIFVASATLAVGVFLYVQFLERSGASKVSQLERAKQAFEPALIQELTRLDDRMRAADQVLTGHIAPSTLFRLLEQLTLKTVSFSALDFQAPSENEIEISMRGIAQSVNAIALQADLLSRSGVMSNPIFSNINRQIGGVRFDFSADLHADALRYRSTAVAPAPIPIETPTEEASGDAPFGTPAPTGTSTQPTL